MKRSMVVAVVVMALILGAMPPAQASTSPLPRERVHIAPSGVVWELLVNPEMLTGLTSERVRQLTLRINAVIINPADPRRVAAALGAWDIPEEAPRHLFGLYLSQDGGQTWGERAPVPPGFLTGNVRGLRLTGLWNEGGRVYGASFNRVLSWSWKGDDLQDHQGWRDNQGRQFLGTPLAGTWPGHFWVERVLIAGDVSLLSGLGLDSFLLRKEGKDYPVTSPVAPVATDHVLLADSIIHHQDNSITVFAKTVTGETRRGFGNVWRVTIPASVIQNPSLLLAPPPPPVVLRLQIGSPELIVEKDGKRTIVVLDANPEIRPEWGRTFLPIRPVVESLGGQIFWFAEDRRVEVQMNDRKVTLWVDNPFGRINGTPVPIDEANQAVRPYIVPPGRTMLPLRFVAEAIGASVEWVAETRAVIVTHPMAVGGP